MKRNITLGLLSCLLLFCACNEEVQQMPEYAAKEISFTSIIEEGISSRAGGATWDENDKIGLFMLKHDNRQELKANVCYHTPNGNGNFVAYGEAMQYPEEGTGVDFLAYYPYQATIDNYTYLINIADQEKPETIDLMYSNNLTNRNQTSVTGNLQFYHQLALLAISFSSTDGSDFSQLKAKVTGVATQAAFNLKNGELTPDTESKGEITLKRSGNTAQAILIPTESLQGVQLLLTLNGKTKTVNLPSNISKFEKGARYSFNINITGNGSVAKPDVASYRKWRETPVITKDMLAKQNIKYINHDLNGGTIRNYSLLYNTDLKMAYWVAYPLCNFYTKKATDRTDAWGWDPAINQNLQPNLKKGFGGGYDRGHQIPSGDRVGSKEMNIATFYYTNMTPQVGQKMNQSIWQELESKVRTWANGTDTLFVVTGAAVDKSNVKYINDNNHKKVAIPTYYYKALARKISGKFHTIAFKLENRDYNDRNYWQGKMSVSDLEKLTGFTFFPSLSQEVKEECDQKYWN